MNNNAKPPSPLSAFEISFDASIQASMKVCYLAA